MYRIVLFLLSLLPVTALAQTDGDKTAGGGSADADRFAVVATTRRLCATRCFWRRRWAMSWWSCTMRLLSTGTIS